VGTGEEGTVTTGEALSGRRVWIDERLVGQTPESFTVKCGRRHVRVGTAGKVQAVDVPCGGEIRVK
jgi:serine/threonine-protein kinase